MTSDTTALKDDFHQGYRNRFQATPWDVPNRPPLRHPKPRILGSQSAVVTGPKGEEIHCDQYGRVKVQFHWDREGQADDKTSCWLRVSSAWAGAQYGGIAIPRIGMEVLVTFLEGDPDQPLISGCLYHKENTVPYALPANKTRSTFKTLSSMGGSGYNELRIEDKKGQEQIYLHAQRDWDENIEHDQKIRVGNERHDTVEQNSYSEFKAYDPLDRLVSVRGAKPETFAHDPAGNLLGQTDMPVANLANVKGNRLLMQGDRHYDYDAYGNLIRERRGANQKLVTEYRYDCQHRLIGVSLPGGSTASYKYDAFGRRIEKTVDSHTTEFLWQGERLIAESGDNHYRTYIYEPGSFRPLAMLDGEGPLKATPFYYQLDHLGTRQELTDYSGEIMWSAKYRAYGNLAALDVSEIDNPLRFQGQYFDAETGLHYNRHRYYNPGTGRFLTPDPIKLAGGLNNYRYVPNPTGWVDPLGLNTCPGGDECIPGQGAEAPEDKARVNQGDAQVPTAAASVNWRGFSSGKLQLHYQKHVIDHKNSET